MTREKFLTVRWNNLLSLGLEPHRRAAQAGLRGDTMTYVLLTLSWLFSLIFGLLTLSMILMRNWLQAMALLGVVLVLGSG